MGATDNKDYNRKAKELSDLIRGIKRQLIKKYGIKVRKYWR